MAKRKSNRVVDTAPEKITTTPRDAFDRARNMEKPLAGIRDFAGALCRVAETLNSGDDVIVLQLAETIRVLVDELDCTHQYFFRLHHPSRARFEQEGWPE
jgi:hypothetical protein